MDLFTAVKCLMESVEDRGISEMASIVSWLHRSSLWLCQPQVLGEISAGFSCCKV